MTLTPILLAPIEIQIHVVAALTAILIGPFSIWRKRRDTLHKTLGVIWIAAMFVLATTGLLIHEIRMLGPFSPIHLFSLLTYYSLWQAVSHLRARRYKAHGMAMKSLYYMALGLTGLFTLLPGRRMNEVLFADFGDQGFVFALILVVLAILWWLVRRRRITAQ